MKLYFKLSKNALLNSLKEGVELKENQFVDVDFSTLNETERSALAHFCKIYNDELFFFPYYGIFYGESTKNNKWFSVGNLDSLNCVKEITSLFENKLIKEKEKEEAEILRKNIDSFLKKISNNYFSIKLISDYSLLFSCTKTEFSSNSYEKTVHLSDFKIDNNLTNMYSFINSEEFNNLCSKIEKEFKEKHIKDELKYKEKIKEKEEREAGIKALKNWSIENGSDLLKLRIKHEQNWLTIAQEEWAVAHSVGFNLFETFVEKEEFEEYNVNNATLEQLLELEKAIEENPDAYIDIIRCKWVSEWNDIDYRTFIRAYIKTPVNTVILYKEIEDVSDNDEE